MLIRRSADDRMWADYELLGAAVVGVASATGPRLLSMPGSAEWPWFDSIELILSLFS